MKSELLPAKMPEEKRDEAELNAMKMKAERSAELMEEKAKAKRDKMAVATGGKKRGSKMLKAEYKRGKMTKDAEVMDSTKFREHILAMSLFPNIHNKPLMMSGLDSSM